MVLDTDLTVREEALLCNLCEKYTNWNMLSFFILISWCFVSLLLIVRQYISEVQYVRVQF